MACLKAAVKYFVLPSRTLGLSRMTAQESNNLGYYLAVFFLVEIGFRMMIYYISESTMIGSTQPIKWA